MDIDEKMPAKNLEYQLSQILSSADSEAVRSLCSIPDTANTTNSTLLAGGQNGLITMHKLDHSSSDENSSMMDVCNGSQPHCASALLHLSSSSPGQLVAVGSNDSHIRIFDFSQNPPVLKNTLSGHSKAVTSLTSITISGVEYLVSGSWDGFVKIWSISDGNCVSTLPLKHENTVVVMALPSTNKIVTASAGENVGGQIKNNFIRIWEISSSNGDLQGKLLHTPEDNHNGPIRALDFFAGSIVSCSNDGTVKVRDQERAECYSTMVADDDLSKQPPILLDVSSKNNILACACEDGKVVLWEGEEKQTIPHPNCVWKVLFLENMDICTCCQDGSIYIFSTDPKRKASDEVLQTYQQNLDIQKRSRNKGPSKEEIEKLPKWEMNALVAGKKEGQVQVFSKEQPNSSNNRIAIAAQWNDASRTWIEVGQVMGEAGGDSSNNAGMIDGVMYDYVLPIEIDLPDGGLQKLQIGYNTGQNPFVTAQEFIDKYMLDQNYLSQIADYIQQRVGAENITIGDPSTTTNTTQSSGPAKKQYQYIPFKSYFSFEDKDTAKVVTKISNKIREFVDSSTTNVDYLDSLEKTLKATSRYHATTISREELRFVKDAIIKFEMNQTFAALDLMRVSVLHPDGITRDTRFWSDVIDAVLSKCNKVSGSESEKLVTAIPMLAFRLLINLFYRSSSADSGGATLREALGSKISSIITTIGSKSALLKSNKTQRLCLSTIMLNTSIFLLEHLHSSLSSLGQLKDEDINALTQTMSALLESCCSNEGGEALTRSLLAAGNLFSVSSTSSAVKSLNLVASMKAATANNPNLLDAKGLSVFNEICDVMG